MGILTFLNFFFALKNFKIKQKFSFLFFKLNLKKVPKFTHLYYISAKNK